MKPEREIFRRARRPLHILGLAIFLGLTLAFGSIYVRESLRKGLATSEGVLDARQKTLEMKKTDLQSIRTHIARFRQLSEQGLIGTAEREAWVEHLVTLRSRLGVGASLAYNLEPPRSLDDAAAPAPATPPANPPASPGAPSEVVALSHDLMIELRGAHEAEVLALLETYRNTVKGRARVQSCRMGNRTPDGLVAECTIRFFNLPLSSGAS